VIGATDTQRTIEAEEYADPEYTSNEYTVADACMIADGTGYMLKHPFVNGHLQKVLARWAYKLFTSGGIVLPGFCPRGRWLPHSPQGPGLFRVGLDSAKHSGRCTPL